MIMQRIEGGIGHPIKVMYRGKIEKLTKWIKTV